MTDNIIRNSKGQTPSEFITDLVHKIRLNTNDYRSDGYENHLRQTSLEALIMREILDNEWRLVPIHKAN